MYEYEGYKQFEDAVEVLKSVLPHLNDTVSQEEDTHRKEFLFFCRQAGKKHREFLEACYDAGRKKN